MSSILVLDQEHIQMPMYYVTKALHGAKLRYLPMEKLSYALVTMMRLRPYFQAHTIVVLTNQPLRAVL